MLPDIQACHTGMFHIGTEGHPKTIYPQLSRSVHWSRLYDSLELHDRPDSHKFLS